MTRLGELLRLYRAVHDLTTRELAAELDVHYTTISRMEHREGGLSADNLMKVMRWLLSSSKHEGVPSDAPHQT